MARLVALTAGRTGSRSTDFEVEEIMEWIGQVTANPPPDFFDVDHANLLYDDEGLPK